MSDRFDDAPNMAIFCDYENVALGARDAKYETFDIRLVLERLLDKGKIVVKKAYADWDRYKHQKRGMHEAGFEMIEIPHVSYSGKNSADIRLVVDALDLCYVKEHVDIFAIVSGDSDFSPLVAKLRENNKRVIGVGVKSSTSELLRDNCDEFIYYDDLVRLRAQQTRRSEHPAKAKRSSPRDDDRSERPEPTSREARDAKERPESRPEPKVEAARVDAPKTEAKAEGPKTDTRPIAPPPDREARADAPKTEAIRGDAEARSEQEVEQRRIEALELVLDVTEALFQDRDGPLHASLVKQTLKRKRPEFSERFHGYRTFTDLLEDAQRRGLLDLHADEGSGGFVVAGFGPRA